MNYTVLLQAIKELNYLERLTQKDGLDDYEKAFLLSIAWSDLGRRFAEQSEASQ